MLLRDLIVCGDISLIIYWKPFDVHFNEQQLTHESPHLQTLVPHGEAQTHILLQVNQ